MAHERLRRESAATVSAAIAEARAISGDLLCAVDQEIAGIQRLSGMVDPFPPSTEFEGAGPADFESICATVAGQAKAIGINCVLAPMLDRLTGPNPWLDGRTWSSDIDVLSIYSSAYIRGVQRAGVIATAKHFPGYSEIDRDPAISIDAELTVTADELEENLHPFAAAISNGVEMVMTGPAPVKAIDDAPASLSRAVIGILRTRLQFRGVILTDDLDGKATARDRSLPDCAIAALNAGADLLLVGAGEDALERIPEGIERAVTDGRLAARRLEESADRVRSLARKYGV